MKKWIVALIFIALVVGGVVLYIHERHDLHHTAYRRDWKNNAIREIRSDITNPKFFIERFGVDPSQSATLKDFRTEFYLESFDGVSDDALNPTWKR